MHFNVRKWIAGGTVAVSLLWGGGLLAATDGTVGTSSTGTVDISVVVGEVVRITSLADFSITTDGTTTQTDSQGVCIYSTRGATGDYVVQADSTNEGGTGLFRLSDGAVVIPYAVAWEDHGTAGSASGSYPTGDAFVEGTPKTGQTNGDISDQTCGGGDAATLWIQITDTDMSGKSGSFSDTLTLLVTPT